MQPDNLHYSFNAIDGYQKDFNFVVSPREDGKTTAFLLKAFRAFLKGQPTIVFRRYGNDITDAYISGLFEVLEKFLDKRIPYSYKEGDKKEGIVDVKSGDGVIFRIIALNQPISRIKSLFLKNAAYCFMDEFICNTRLGEKYLKEEAFKFKEIFNTFQRESDHLRAVFTGNPYSLYNPYFTEFGIPENKLKKGGIICGPNWAAERHILNPELVKLILAKNPLYKFGDDAYAKYAVQGDAVNDANIQLMLKLPQFFSLYCVFGIDDKLLGIYKNDASQQPYDFWVGYIDAIGSRRCAYCFDFKDLCAHSVLFSNEDRNRFARFRNSLRNRLVVFQSLECDYLIEEVYAQL